MLEMKTKFPLSIPKLIKKADRLFQRLRVLEEVDEQGYGFCITCIKPVRLHHSKLDGGHFIGKGLGGAFLAVRYEKNNVWPQCIRCNRFQSGNYSIYRDNLIKIVGVVEVERLEKEKYKPIVFLRSFLEEILESFKRGA